MRRVLGRPTREYADARELQRLVRRVVRQAFLQATVTIPGVDPRRGHGSMGRTEPTERQHGTGRSAGDDHDVVIDPNEHIWQTESRHPTSDGAVSYQRCRCGLWRVLLGPNQVLAEARITPTSAATTRV